MNPHHPTYFSTNVNFGHLRGGRQAESVGGFLFRIALIIMAALTGLAVMP